MSTVKIKHVGSFGFSSERYIFPFGFFFFELDAGWRARFKITELVKKMPKCSATSESNRLVLILKIYLFNRHFKAVDLYFSEYLFPSPFFF